MAIGIVQEFSGVTMEQYDEALSLMGFAPDGPGASGCLFHWVTKTDNGFRITDVWESEEAFGKFAEEKIGPITAKVGITSEPQIAMYAVHNYLTAG